MPAKKKRDKDGLRDELIEPWRACAVTLSGLAAFFVSVLAIDSGLHFALRYSEKILHADLPLWIEPFLSCLFALLIGITAFLCVLKHLVELLRILFARKADV